MSVTKNHSHAMPTFGPGRVIDPAKRRTMNTVLFVSIGVFVAIVAVISLWSVFGGAIPPAEQPPVVINTPTTEPTSKPEPTVKPAATPTTEPTAEPTQEPTVAPTTEPTSKPTDSPTTEPTATASPISIPENFIVKDEYWGSAAFLLWTDGRLYKSAILFPSISVGDKLYAPMSGYIRKSNVQGKFGHHTEISISVTWSESGREGQYVIFAAQDFELLDIGLKDDHLYVEKGEAFAKVKESAELFPGTYEQKPEFMVIFDKDWADTLDDSIEDPREYAWLAFQNLE